MKKTKGKSKVQRTEEEKMAVMEQICDIYSIGDVTIESVCNEFGISNRTLLDWVKKHPKIADLYKKAKESASRFGKETIREKALNGLQVLITGQMIEEEEVEEIFDRNGVMIRKIVRKRKKYIAPNPTAVIFSLKNCDPLHWNDQFQFDFGMEEQVFKIGNKEIRFK